MKKYLILVFSVMLISCGSSTKLIDSTSYEGTINLSAENLSIISKTPWFSQETSESITGNNLVEQRGDYLLSEVLYGYENQLADIRMSSYREADIQFVVKEIRVKRGHFTFNFPNPGPLYRMMMDVDIYKDGILVDDITLRTKVNMSVINFGHLPFKWMSPSEMGNSEYQLATFEAGLTKLYQKLYFNYLDISLYL